LILGKFYGANEVSQLGYGLKLLDGAEERLDVLELVYNILVATLVRPHLVLQSELRMDAVVPGLQVFLVADGLFYHLNLGNGVLSAEGQDVVVEGGLIEEGLDYDLVEQFLLGGLFDLLPNEVGVELQDELEEEGREGL
jgi:hypothetical protein